MMVLDEVQWRQARCLTVETAKFYPERGNGDDPHEVRRRVCSTCPIKKECLDLGMENEEQYGIWGGTTPRQRLAMHRDEKFDPQWQWPRISLDEYMAPPPLRTECDFGHELFGDDAALVPGTNQVQCNVCRRERKAKNKAAKRAKERASV